MASLFGCVSCCCDECVTLHMKVTGVNVEQWNPWVGTVNRRVKLPWRLLWAVARLHCVLCMSRAGLWELICWGPLALQGLSFFRRARRFTDLDHPMPSISNNLRHTQECLPIKLTTVSYTWMFLFLLSLRCWFNSEVIMEGGSCAACIGLQYICVSEIHCMLRVKAPTSALTSNKRYLLVLIRISDHSKIPGISACHYCWAKVWTLTWSFQKHENILLFIYCVLAFYYVAYSNFSDTSDDRQGNKSYSDRIVFLQLMVKF